MRYIDLYNKLKKQINYDEHQIYLDNDIIVENLTFESDHQHILPGGKQNLDNDEYTFDKSYYDPDSIQSLLNQNDAEITENIHFKYQIFYPARTEKQKKVIFLFHGFNEKYWDKYQTWAKRLVETTGKAVIMFPIAFHMNRAPHSWSDPHKMYAICQERKKRYPDIICSTLSNIAISTRLHNKPQRFIWSGLQTYYDIIKLLKQIKKGEHPIIDPTTTVDILSYSIGSMLAQILMMTNENGYFSESRLCMFCGGAVFNRLSPVTKFILDSEVNVNLYSYIVEHLESHIAHNPALKKYLGDSHPEGINFRSMLNYKSYAEYREKIFKSLENQMMAITLTNDTVIPSYEIINTLNGVKRDIPIPVIVLDYPYPYKHEDPFPATEANAKEIDKAFNQTFDKICEFLR